MHFINERSIPFVEDSTNSLDVFTRNKLRHTVIPVFRGINPRFTEAAAVTAELSRADEEYLCALADEFITEQGICAPIDNATAGNASLDAGELQRLPFAVSSRVVRRLCGGKLSFRHVKAVLGLCGSGNASARLSLPGITVVKEYSRIVFDFGQASRADGFETVFPEDGESVMIPALNLAVSCKSVLLDAGCAVSDTINKSFTSFLFKNANICGKMTVRSRREGDSVRLLGHNCTKTLKKLFIERRIPVRSRALVPVIADDHGVLAIYGIGMGDRAVPEPGDAAIQIDFTDLT